MSIAGHVSRAIPSRYSHVRMEAKRHALDEIGGRQGAADQKRRQEAERQTVVMPSQSAVVTRLASLRRDVEFDGVASRTSVGFFAVKRKNIGGGDATTYTECSGGQI